MASRSWCAGLLTLILAGGGAAYAVHPAGAQHGLVAEAIAGRGLDAASPTTTSTAVPTSTPPTTVTVPPPLAVSTPKVGAKVVGSAPPQPIVVGPVPSGSPDDYVLAGGHWDRSMPIGVYSTIAEVWPIIAQVGAITGLHFVPVASAAQAQVTITYGPLPAGDGAGTQLTPAPGSPTIIGHAMVVFLAGHATTGNLRHEIGHVVGLGHAHRPGEVMYPVEPVPSQYSPSDLAGLRAVAAL